MQAVAKLSTTEAQKTLQGVKIPSQPKILLHIRKEQAKPHPDMQVIADLICKDVGLSAAVLKTINSPFYGMRRRIDSIQQAAVLLGIKNVSSLVTSSVLRSTINDKACISLERFWDSATDIANISLMLAKHFYLPYPDDSYTLGLFHDCGIALMAQKFPDYVEALAEGNSSADRTLTEVEDECYNTSHAVVGYYTCKSWHLPETISTIVRDHHNLDQLFLATSDSVVRDQMLAILKMAGYFCRSFQSLQRDLEWDRIHDDVLQVLVLDEDQFDEIEQYAHEALEQKGQA